MATLAEIQAKLREQQEENKQREENRGKKSGGGDNAQFRFFDMKVDEESIYRFLPDGDSDNIFPWVERQTIELPFDGTVGGEVDTTEAIKVKVPCPTMFHALVPDYKIACKITAHIRPWWNPKGGEMYSTAQKYYRKQSWLMQGFPRAVPFTEENVPENPIRRVTLQKKVFDKVFRAYNGTEFEHAPHDFEQGTDFIFRKTKQGEWNNYDTSDFARRTSSLTDEEKAAVATYGLFNLKDFVGKAPTQEDVDAMYEMFLDSLAGKPYDFGKYGSVYRPFGVKGPARSDDNANAGATTETAAASSTPAASTGATTSAPAETPSEASPAASSTQTDDLIARIRRNAMTQTEG